jgi:NADH dehydrogenase (ubiquinone) 1 beta subcomplex subunit 3
MHPLRSRTVVKSLSSRQILATRQISTTTQRLAAPLRDPWAKREAWRHSPTFGTWRQISQMFPGLGLAIVAFGAYLAWESVSGKDEEGAHGHH